MLSSWLSHNGAVNRRVDIHPEEKMDEAGVIYPHANSDNIGTLTTEGVKYSTAQLTASMQRLTTCEVTLESLRKIKLPRCCVF